jgi:hypothetical protein
MNTLKPSINIIRHNLFAPCYQLVKAWVEQPETLDYQIIQQLEASTVAQQEKQAYLQANDPKETHRAEDITNELFTDQTPQNLEVPDAIKNLIQQRNEANKHYFSHSPREGLILLLGDGNGSAEDLALAIASPLTIILNKATENKNIWEAWMVTKETDYATNWDLLLTPEQDAPLDPLAGMVQVWNPIKIYLPLAEKAIGELKPARLAELRTLASDYKTTISLTDDAGKTSDDVHQYQKMYSDVASFINKKALVTKDPFTQWKASILSQAEKLGQLFTFVPVVSYAMGTESDDDSEKNWLLDGKFLFSFNKQILVGHQLLVEVSIEHTDLKDNSFSIEYKEKGFLAHHAILSQQTSKTEFICDPYRYDADNPTELVIKDSKGNELHRLCLSPDYAIKS